MWYQMTARTDRSDIGRFSPAYATGREFGAKGNRSIVRVFDCLIVNRSDRECHGNRMNAARQRCEHFQSMRSDLIEAL